MITLDNCDEWLTQQPERLAFIELNWQDDMRVLCVLKKSETTREQWNKTVEKFTNRKIYRIEFENVDGKSHCWVYFKEGE